ncbi:MAG: hypothetical protein QGG67_02965 [Gammaproteobacteria bacterium]|nr:hypothetical protein [Gammaproteobacteria bacterium]
MIAISADHQLQEKEDFDKYLIKPVNINRLCKALDSQLAGLSVDESKASAIPGK